MTSQTSHRAPQAVRGAVTRKERALAPDLARGMMLLIVALAHSACAFFLTTPGAKQQPEGLESLYNVFLFTCVHARGNPLFAIMFGYALVQMAQRQESAGAGPRQVRAVLLRRNAWLFVIGAAHGILLFDGDILGAYGIIGVGFALLAIRRSDRFIRVAGLGYLGFSLLYVVVLAVMATLGLPGGSGRSAPLPLADNLSYAADGYPASMIVRLAEWPMVTLVFLPLFLYTFIGAWAARHRLLEEPEKHRTLLRRGAIVGLGISITGGLPMGLYAAGFLAVDADAATRVKMLYEVSGFFGGIGYGCLFGLIAIRLSGRTVHGTVVTAITALGQRSLSGYLAQSVFWLVLGTPFLLDLSKTVTANGFLVGVVGVAVWLFTVVVAYVMHQLSYRGPAELLLRRLTYGKR
ncbi:MAG TPA: DUF418 domain-containing protein [Candidatus Stackebrandtia excrementipullorum]|nr:DUF418 domain-containing protein [Candidatus Stackebrandtia excrementipullorum]